MWQLSCVLAVAVLCAVSALPTQTDKTLVVARDENNDNSASTTPVADITTAEPLAPIKILEMDVKSDVSLRYAHTAVVTRARNPSSRSQEATFHVLLPNTAFISGFVMTLNGKSYKAYVKEKEEAKQIYNDAVSQGIGAAHVAAKARDSNQFTVSINVEPQTEAVFNLTYEELLQRRNSVYNHAINLHPSALVPKLTVTVNVKENTKLTTLRVPEMRTGNEIDATENDAQNTKAKIEKSADQKQATITFTPDLEEQKKLMDIYKVKSKLSKPEGYSSGYYGEQEERPTPAEGNLGQFVVQYDVERSDQGEVLVSDGYFVHFFAPSSLPPLEKHIVFVLDTSGSMMGRKISQLREAMVVILGELNPGDYFNLVEFSSDVSIHNMKEADEEKPKNTYHFYYGEPRKPVKLVPPSKATKENIDKAKIIVNRMGADGGTNIDLALKVAIDLANKGVGWTPEKDSDKKTEDVTDESVEELPRAVPLVDVKPSTEAPITKDSSKVEPIIIFLTDGEPTVGNSDINKIISHVSERNSGQYKTAIFSLAFGEDADRSFLRKLSLRNDAFMRHIYEASDAALQLRDFYRQVSSPLLSDVRFVYPPEQVKEKSLTKHRFHTYYAGSEVVVAGKLSESPEPTGKQEKPELIAEVFGFCGTESPNESDRRKPYKVAPKISAEYLPLERLWAYLTIKQLLDDKDAELQKEDKKKDETAEKKALRLALKYEFVTPLTSLVVVKPNATSAVDAESNDKPDSPPLYGFPGAISPMAISNYQSFDAARPAGAGYLAAPGLPGPAPFADAFMEEDEVELLIVPDHSPPYTSNNVFITAPSRPALAIPGYNRRVGGSTYGSSHLFGGSSNIYGAGLSSGYGHRNSGYLSRPLYASSAVFLPSPSLSGRQPEPISKFVSSTAPVYNPLSKYKLEEFPWVTDLLEADDKLAVKTNQTTIKLQLVADDSVPISPSDSCASAVSVSGPGKCVYLTRCPEAKTITSQEYLTHYCDINGFAGVCCPVKAPQPTS